MTELPVFSTVQVAAQGALGFLTLTRPGCLNALSLQALRELMAAAQWFDAQPDVNVVLVAAQGRAFCAGFDLLDFAAQPQDEASVLANGDLGRQMVQTVAAMRAVTVVAVQGHCVGAGLLLVSACDLRVAATDAVFLIPELDLGIPLAWGGIARLVRELGPALTRDLVLTARPWPAAQALAAGFLSRLVEPAEVSACSAELASALARRPAFLLQTTKRSIEASAQALLPADNAQADAGLLLQALHDAPSRAATAAYLSSRMARVQTGS